MSSLHGGNQLGNRIFEILGVAAIAKRLHRRPSFLLQSDSFNQPVIRQLWKTLHYFPNVLDGFFLESESLGLNISSLPRVNLKAQPSTYINFSRFDGLEKERIVVIDAAFLQNIQYLNDLGWEEVAFRLGFTEETLELTKLILPDDFRKRKKRICVHWRRKDFGSYAAKSSYIVKALNVIIKQEAVSNFGITIFSDDAKNLKADVRTEEFKHFANSTWLPIDDHPIHFVWSFLSHQCTHILLTNIQSTFGYLGAYLAGNRSIVYFNPALHWKHKMPTPKEWIQLVV
ncbi:unnamed protein product, partial [Mesorhabditis belari]|uniref:L-Fucosyltransferase n=1 Tax=Mesorhabditis belari TaxID=2138241 RepID=A0AAF3ERG9_9BILA